MPVDERETVMDSQIKVEVVDPSYFLEEVEAGQVFEGFGCEEVMAQMLDNFVPLGHPNAMHDFSARVTWLVHVARVAQREHVEFAIADGLDLKFLIDREDWELALVRDKKDKPLDSRIWYWNYEFLPLYLVQDLQRENETIQGEIRWLSARTARSTLEALDFCGAVKVFVRRGEDFVDWGMDADKFLAPTVY